MPDREEPFSKNKIVMLPYQIPCFYLDINENSYQETNFFMQQMMGGGNHNDEEEEKKNDFSDDESGVGQFYDENNNIIEVDQDDRTKVLMYFHGNAEDIGHNILMLYKLRETFQCSVVAMEYPGYGFYSHEVNDGAADKKKKCEPSPKKIQKNAMIVFEHLTRAKAEGGLGYTADQVILFGRSMGSGPTSLLARMYKPRCLILMSPFTTIKKAAANVAGSFLAFFVATHHNNLEHMKSVRCPVLLIHGKKDTLIPPDHSQQLFDAIIA